jgi:hypothetical protein
MERSAWEDRLSELPTIAKSTAPQCSGATENTKLQMGQKRMNTGLQLKEGKTSS